MKFLLMFDLLQVVSFLYSLLSNGLAVLALTFLVLHLLPSYKQPVQLSQTSFVVLVGGCMGIGRQMCLEIAALYHSTILLVDCREDLFASVSAELTQLGSICHCFYADLSQEASVNQLISHLQTKGKIDLFIYNAGIMIPKRAIEISETEHMKLMRVNYFSAVKMLNSLLPQLKGGHCAVTGSMISLMSGGVNMSIYGASKHALFGYLSSMRQEWKKDKEAVTLSIGLPYAIDTTMFTGFRTKIDWLIPVLSEEYVGKRLVSEFISRKQVCFVYQYGAVLFRLIQFLPSWFLDYLATSFDKSDFSSIKNKHS